jgi:hypothetical protein
MKNLQNKKLRLLPSLTIVVTMVSEGNHLLTCLPLADWPSKPHNEVLMHNSGLSCNLVSAVYKDCVIIHLLAQHNIMAIIHKNGHIVGTLRLVYFFTIH